jgi:hypothetical protein
MALIVWARSFVLIDLRENLLWWLLSTSRFRTAQGEKPTCYKSSKLFRNKPLVAVRFGTKPLVPVGYLRPSCQGISKRRMKGIMNDDSLDLTGVITSYYPRPIEELIRLALSLPTVVRLRRRVGNPRPGNLHHCTRGWQTRCPPGFTTGKGEIRSRSRVRTLWWTDRGRGSRLTRCGSTAETPKRPTDFIACWLDYAHKYGMGYALTNGSVGVQFNDDAHMILSSSKR